MVRLSVIVPVYNAEKYLDKCLNSILGQEYRDFELILIDDGSKDDSGSLCDQYAERDNVKVFHQENKGVSVARNNGIYHAEGDYVTFVDSDDWIEPAMYKNMMQKVEEYQLDAVMCDCIKDFPTHSEVYSHDIRNGYYNSDQLVKEYYPHLIMMENVEYPPTISNWLCIFRRRMITENDLRYIEGVRFSEDLLFGAQVMSKAKSFYYMKGCCYYHYVMNDASATHTLKLDKWNDYMRLHQEATSYFGQEYLPQIDKMLLFFLYNAIGDLLRSTLSNEEKEVRIRGILDETEVREMFSRINVLRLPILNTLKIATLIYKYKIGLRWWISRF